MAGVCVMFNETCILRCQHFAMILDGDTLSLVSEMVYSRHAQESSGRAKGVVLFRFQFLPVGVAYVGGANAAGIVDI